SSVQFPIRFDFDFSEEVYEPQWHSKSHMTLGNTKGCRIPVSGPVSPFRFIDFIMRSFYAEKYKNDLTLFKCALELIDSLGDDEMSLMHINFR
ncbi:MAG: DUF2290 domain-containing protein, partial [Spongiibacter marinus]|uniref:DUF2290 domain-containing protein n=1 Tax=Spongiibacter marinus TaxID=354246 RepID=UPI003C4F2024